MLDKYFYCFDKIASQISDCEQGKNIDEILESPICIEGFKRYN